VKKAPLRLAKGRRSTPFADIEEAVAALKAGKMIVVVDDEDRENEGDLTMAASKVTPEAINFMVKHGRGLVCLAMTPERLDHLDIPLEASDHSARRETAFCVSIDAKKGTTTGISAADRAKTIKVAIGRDSGPRDLSRPGHVFPLRARPGGVLVRSGHTEAAVDLSRIAGLPPAGVICEILNDDGTMARVPELVKFAKKHKMPIITIADLIRYRMRTETMVTRVARAALPTAHGPFEIFAYQSGIDGETHVALVKGDISSSERILVRVHSKCLTGDVFHSLRCDCGPQLDTAMQRIAQEGQGVLLYCIRKGAGSASATRSRRTNFRIRGSIPSRLMSGSGSSPTSATTASARRFCATWASGRCACSPTTRGSSSASKATGCPSSSPCRSRLPRPTTRAST